MTRLVPILLLAGAAWAGEPDAAHLFRARCANCHTVPDPALPTDRAWLDQVNRTT